MCTGIVHNVALGNVKIPKNLRNIPHFKKFWKQFCSLKYAEDSFKNKLLNELVDECNINYPKLLVHRYGKQLLIRLDFKTLQKYNLFLDYNSITETLLSYLEPFPFDSRKLEKEKTQGLCVEKIRNVIEKQYLIWKYQVDEKEIEELIFKYKFCFYPFRSIRNLRKSIFLLETMSKTRKVNLDETIYLINQKPFSLNTVNNFKEKVVGINWRTFPHHCFKILRHSHEYILFVVSVLQQLEFTDAQIRAGFPLLHLPFKTIIFRLNNLLEHPEISKYRNEEFFLHLLYFGSQELFKSVSVSYTELIEIVRISIKNRTQLLNPKIIRKIVSQFYEIENSYFNVIPRHAKYKLTSEKQMYDTLFFLKQNNFTSKEVAESITIIFYPRNFIAKTLEKIKEKESVLKKIGFKDGCVAEKTKFFARGTKEKRKTLQLCLYYMEKFHISGDEMTVMKPDAANNDLVTSKGNTKTLV